MCVCICKCIKFRGKDIEFRNKRLQGWNERERERNWMNQRTRKMSDSFTFTLKHPWSPPFLCNFQLATLLLVHLTFYSLPSNPMEGRQRFCCSYWIQSNYLHLSCISYNPLLSYNEEVRESHEQSWNNNKKSWKDPRGSTKTSHVVEMCSFSSTSPSFSSLEILPSFPCNHQLERIERRIERRMQMVMKHLFESLHLWSQIENFVSFSPSTPRFLLFSPSLQVLEQHTQLFSPLFSLSRYTFCILLLLLTPSWKDLWKPMKKKICHEIRIFGGKGSKQWLLSPLPSFSPLDVHSSFATLTNTLRLLC